MSEQFELIISNISPAVVSLAYSGLFIVVLRMLPKAIKEIGIKKNWALFSLNSKKTLQIKPYHRHQN